MKRCLILVEGPTEERFVKDLLAVRFEPLDFHLTPIILTTKLVKSGGKFKGGVTSYAKMRADLTKLLVDTGALITTMIDYYGLPADTPGMSDRPVARPVERVRHVEEAILRNLGYPRHFMPFQQLADPVGAVCRQLTKLLHDEHLHRRSPRRATCDPAHAA